MLPTRVSPHNKRSTQTESEGLEKIFQTNRQEKEKARVAILISDKMTSKQKPKKRHGRTLHNTQGKNP